jgi:hypothetical protein
MVSQRLAWMKRKSTQRAILGFALIGISVAGTAATIAVNNNGTTAVMASRVIPAGSLISDADVYEVRVSSISDLREVTLADVVGRRASADLAVGSTVVSADLEPASLATSLVSVPLSISPAESISPGRHVQLWSMSSDELEPVRLVARNAVVVSRRDSGFGGEVMMDVSLSFREVHTVLAAIGANARIVATTASDE